MLEPWSVECVGTLALISYWTVLDEDVLEWPRLGSWRGTVLGNDAVLVAGVLMSTQLNARCLLLDPTSADVRRATAALGRGRVVAIGGKRGRISRSLCVENSTGQRSWICSRLPDPQVDIGKLTATLVYVDWYRELGEYLARVLAGTDEPIKCFINLSWMTTSEEIPALGVRPVVVQASIGEGIAIKDAFEYAGRLAKETGAERAFVTMGAGGAVLAASDGVWHSQSKALKMGRVMGAGATFSSAVIIGLANGLDREALLEAAVQFTAAKLTTPANK